MKPTKLDKTQAEYYSKMPELLVGFDPWETLRFCAVCEGEIEDHFACLYETRNGYNPKIQDYRKTSQNRNDGGENVTIDKISCPHCLCHGKHNFWYRTDKKTDGGGEWFLDSIYRAEPIETEIIFRRKVWLSKRRKKFFGWEGEDRWFYEYSEPQKSENKNDP